MTGGPGQQSGGQPAAQAGQGRALFHIQAFTALYDPVEDRLRLDSADAEGRTHSIFLTRRLTDRIIPVIVSHLEAKTGDGVPKILAQEMQQSGARQARQIAESAPTVRAKEQTRQWLCRTIHCRKAQNGLILTFTDDSTVDAVIQMADANLRAVLDIFLELYTKGGWPADALPEWLKPEAAVNATDGDRLN
jgi:hypothetical protein